MIGVDRNIHSSFTADSNMLELRKTALILCHIFPYGPSNDGGNDATSMLNSKGNECSPGSRAASGEEEQNSVIADQYLAIKELSILHFT